MHILAELLTRDKSDGRVDSSEDTQIREENPSSALGLHAAVTTDDTSDPEQITNSAFSNRTLASRR